MEYKTLDDRKVDNTKSNTNKDGEEDGNNKDNDEIHEIIEGFNITKLKERYPDQTNQIIQFKESLLAEEENSVIDIWEMQNLGIQSIEMISQSSDPFDKLRDISWNFPSYVSSISRVKVEPKVQKELDSLYYYYYLIISFLFFLFIFLFFFNSFNSYCLFIYVCI